MLTDNHVSRSPDGGFDELMRKACRKGDQLLQEAMEASKHGLSASKFKEEQDLIKGSIETLTRATTEMIHMRDQLKTEIDIAKDCRAHAEDILVHVEAAAKLDDNEYILDRVKAYHQAQHSWSPSNLQQPTMPAIAASIASVDGFTLEDIVGHNRGQGLCRTRQKIFYHLRETMGNGLSDVARALNRDHSTVRHGICQHKKLLEKEKQNGKSV